jgi:hypothetical protein
LNPQSARNSGKITDKIRGVNTAMNSGEILIYENTEGNIKIDVRLEEETVWLTQAQLCALSHKSKATISEHVKIYSTRVN